MFNPVLGVHATALLTVLLVNGCVHVPPASLQAKGNSLSVSTAQTVNTGPVAAEDLEGSAMVAADLVHVLVQISGLQPGRVPLLVHPPANAFERKLLELLSAAGYKLRTGNGATEALNLATSIKAVDSTEDSAADRLLRIYQLDVGQIKLKRIYAFSNGRVEPQSDMFLKGADSSTIKLDETLFEPENTQPRISHNEQLTASTAPAVEKSPATGKEPYPLIALKLQTGGTTGATDYRQGDPITVSLVASRNSQVFCFYQDGEGKVAQLFPNRFRPDNNLEAGETLHLPESGDWQMTAARAGVDEQFLCIAARPELAPRLHKLATMPDLQPMPVSNLREIYHTFEQAAGEPLGNQSISIAVR